MFSSCQKDENLGGANSGEALVTVTTSVPQAVGTRAAMNSTSDKGGVVNVDDSKYDLRFVLRIYEGGKVVKEETWTGSTQTLEYQKQYRLVPGHDYKFVVWADFVKEGTTTDLYYNTADFAAVSELPIAADDTRINNEARDAYFVAQDENDLAENASVNLTLKRPFGKVRVVTTDWNEDAIQNATVPTEVKITYNNTTLYTGMDLLTGALTGSNATMEYTAAINDYTNEGATVAEKTLYVDYLWGKTITNPDTATAATVEQYAIHFTIDAGIRSYDVKTNVPISRNWLTTVKGNILTTNTNINIEVDPEFDNEHTTTSQQALELAAVNGGDVTLTEDVVLTETLEINANMTINLNGKTITGNLAKGSGAIITNTGTLTITGNGTITNTAENGDVVINNSGNLVLDGATIKGAPIGTTGYPAYAIVTTGTLTVEDGTTIVSDRGAIEMSDAEVTINGGNISVNCNRALTSHVIWAGSNSTLTINGGEFAQNFTPTSDTGASVISPAGATIKVYGGNFVYTGPTGGQGGIFQNYMGYGVPVNVYGGTYNDNTVVKNVAAGYVAAKNTDGTYTVKEGTGANNAASLQNAINNAAAGSKIVLTDSEAEYGTITAGELKDVTIEGNGETTIIFKADADTKIENVTLKNIKFEYTGATADAGVVLNASAQVENLVLENCTLVGNGTKAGRGLSGYNNNATIVIKNCTFKDLGYPIYAWGGYASLTIEGCTFDNIKSWAIMPQSGFDGDLTVTGCTFKNCIGGGLIKAGTLTAGHTFTFTNNTITNCTGHNNRNWFEFTVSAGTSVISGNTKDGVAWTPTTTDGLK